MFEDLKKINKIFLDEYSKKPYNEKWNPKDSLKKIKKYHKNGEIFVLTIDKKVEGFIIGQEIIWDWGTLGMVDEFVVSKKFQNKGYGKALLNHIEKYFRSCTLAGARQISTEVPQGCRVV